MSTWKAKLRAHVKPLAYRLRSKHLYRLASFYVNAVDNDHDSDFFTNGEALFARKQLPGCRIAFDLGAAKGAWTEIALAANPTLEVHCFEPTSRRQDVLRGRNFGPRAVLNKLAMGEAAGESMIYCGASGGSNSLYPQRYAGETYEASNVEKVEVSTLDHYCKQRQIEHVDFIKMDIEGYEMAAIKGAQDLIRAGNVDVIQFEYSYVFLDAGTSLKALMEYVHSLSSDYDFYKIYPDGIRAVPTWTHVLDNFKTQNWAVAKRGRLSQAHVLV